MNLAGIATSREETSLFLFFFLLFFNINKCTPGKSFSSLSPSLHTNINLKVTQKLLPSFQSPRIKKIGAWSNTSHFGSLSSQAAAPKENNPEKFKNEEFFKINLSEVTQVGIIPPYWHLHLLRSWGVSGVVRVLQGLKGETDGFLQGSEQGHCQGFQGVWERQYKTKDHEDPLIREWDEKSAHPKDLPVVSGCPVNWNG